MGNAPSHWPADMRADWEQATAPRDEDRMDEKCVVCDGAIRGPGWWVERVDAWGERVWSGYVCSAMCLRKTAKKQRADSEAEPMAQRATTPITWLHNG